jgi:predicted solute-binding protein
MVFAMWSGRQRDGNLEAILEDSYAYGSERIHEILSAEAAPRGIDRHLAEQYLRRNIVYRLDEDARAGMRLYLSAAAELESRMGVFSA